MIKTLFNQSNCKFESYYIYISVLTMLCIFMNLCNIALFAKCNKFYGTVSDFKKIYKNIL